MGEKPWRDYVKNNCRARSIEDEEREARNYVNPCKAKCSTLGFAGNSCCERKCSASAPGYSGVEKPWRDYVKNNCRARSIEDEEREARNYVNPCKAKCSTLGFAGNSCCERKCSASAPGYSG